MALVSGVGSHVHFGELFFTCSRETIVTDFPFRPVERFLRRETSVASEQLTPRLAFVFHKLETLVRLSKL